MNNNSSAELFPVYAAIPLTKLLFDLVVSEDDVLEIARLVLRQTKNAGTKTYLLAGAPIVDCHVTLPGDIFEIKGVFAAGKAINEATSMSVLINHGRPLRPEHLPLVSDADVTADSFLPDNVAVNIADLVSELSTGAELAYRNLNQHQTLDYNYREGELSFRQKSGKVDVIYTLKPQDCDGVEQVPEAVIETIAYYFNYMAVRKRFLRGQAPMTIMEFAKSEYERKAAQARMGGRISDNARKHILDVLHSMDRHQYGPAK